MGMIQPNPHKSCCTRLGPEWCFCGPQARILRSHVHAETLDVWHGPHHTHLYQTSTCLYICAWLCMVCRHAFSVDKQDP